MNDALIKVYGNLYPVGQEALDAVNKVLASWFLQDAASLEGDLLLISFEGDYFPTTDIIAAMKPFLCDESRGKLDEMDMEAWMLHRWFFDHGHLMDRKASLNHALESCSMK